MRLLYHHIRPVASYRSREKWIFVFVTTVQWMRYANYVVYYGLNAVSICLHYHHRADLSENIEQINCLSVYFRVYDSLAIVCRCVMKQLYAPWVLVCSY